MPGMNGIEAMRHVINNSPKVKVIMLSMYSSGPWCRVSWRPVPPNTL